MGKNRYSANSDVCWGLQARATGANPVHPTKMIQVYRRIQESFRDVRALTNKARTPTPRSFNRTQEKYLTQPLRQTSLRVRTSSKKRFYAAFKLSAKHLPTHPVTLQTEHGRTETMCLGSEDTAKTKDLFESTINNLQPRKCPPNFSRMLWTPLEYLLVSELVGAHRNQFSHSNP